LTGVFVAAHRGLTSEVCTIARSRYHSSSRDFGKRLRINDQIRVPQVRLIDENNEQVGVIETDDAKRRARDARLDLVEVSPKSDPPVCRIMDYGKWKYQQKKKEQKASSHSKQSQLKGVRLRPKIDDHDLSIKLNRANGFLQEGHKVQFTMILRGREMVHRNLAHQTMRGICDHLGDVSKVESPPRMAGRRMTMVLAPDRKGKASSKNEPAKAVDSGASAPTEAAVQSS